MRLLAAVIAATAFLAGCEDPMTQDERVISFREKCESYGFSAGSPAMAQCIASENRAYESDLSDRRARIAAALANTGSHFQSTAPSMTNCNSSVFGSTVTTSCVQY